MRWYPKSSPRSVEGGIEAESKRGDIGEKWWSRRFVDVVESYAIKSRIQRGKRYARRGQVVELAVTPGAVEAAVQGSRPSPYDVDVGGAPISDSDWESIEQALAKRADFTARLLSGQMPANIEQVFDDCGTPLFPASYRDMETGCSCPDSANPCKHIAAVFYILAERFDDDPFLILRWRGRTRDQFLKRLRNLRGGANEVADPPLEEVLDTFWGEDLETRLPEVAPRDTPANKVMVKRLGDAPDGLENVQSAVSMCYHKMSRRRGSSQRLSALADKFSTAKTRHGEEQRTETIFARLTSLRSCCVKAHNRLTEDSGYSVLDEVLQAIEPNSGFATQSATHRLLSNYAFFGTTAVGGSRNGFRSRFADIAEDEDYKLYRRIKDGTFAAWRVTEVNEGEDQIVLTGVGIPDESTETVGFATDTQARPISPREGEIRVGWVGAMPGNDTPAGLVFSTALQDEAVDRLVELAASEQWFAQQREGEFLAVEYERDVLGQVLAPGHENDPENRSFQFLPPSQRQTFPARFGRNLLRRLRDAPLLSNKRSPWHLQLARADSPSDLQKVRERFSEIRRNAARAAGRHRGDQLDLSKVDQIATDTDLFYLMGLKKDVSIQGDTLCSRWRALMAEFYRRLDDDPDSVPKYLTVFHQNLAPDYDQLWTVASQLFDEETTDARLRGVLPRKGGVPARICTAIRKTGVNAPVRIKDLPESEFDLRRIRGIGQISVTMICKGLRTVLVGD